jgi:hypothetical protein
MRKGPEAAFGAGKLASEGEGLRVLSFFVVAGSIRVGVATGCAVGRAWGCDNDRDVASGTGFAGA